MKQLVIEQIQQIPTCQRRFEHVERKGIGHPDTMCDSIMEQVSLALSRVYLENWGRVLHYNVDKGMLIAGRSTLKLGGGAIVKPMRIIFGDRATEEVCGRRIAVGEIACDAATKWLSQHLRFVEPASHVVFQNEIQPGSPELVDAFSRAVLPANDTSAAVGYAPLTETEQLVIEAEHFLNSAAFKERFPEVGEDVKVMGFRSDRSLSLTVAIAFVDRFILSISDYFERKVAVREELQRHLESRLVQIEKLAIDVNTLDDPHRGLGGMYLTVLGTSAENADSGQVGRGNRANGVISLHRPMSAEAVAGKNPVSHVGKIYNLLAHRMAGRIYSVLPELDEVQVWMCSQIGRPLADPWSVAVELISSARGTNAEVQAAVKQVIENELENMPQFVQQLTRGEFPVC